MRLFSPRKTTLLFVIRDKTKVLQHARPDYVYLRHLTFVLPFSYFVFLADSYGIFRASTKGRYSKGLVKSFPFISTSAVFFHFRLSQWSPFYFIPDMGFSC